MKSKTKLTEEEKEDLAFAVSVATTGGVAPSKFAKKLLVRYIRGEISYEEAKKEIDKRHRKKDEN